MNTWRDKKIIFTYVIIISALFFWGEFSKRGLDQLTRLIPFALIITVLITILDPDMRNHLKKNKKK